MDTATNSPGSPAHICRESWQRTAIRAVLRRDRKTLVTVLERDALDTLCDEVSASGPEDRHECASSARREVVGLVEHLCLDDLATELCDTDEPAYDALCAWAAQVAEDCGEQIADAVCEQLGDARAYSRDAYGYYGVSEGDFL